MTQPAKSQEPSMEEILASIRRIIADDDASKSALRAAEAAVEAKVEARAETRPEANVERPPAPPPRAEAPAPLPVQEPEQTVNSDAVADESADILDLTESMAAPPPQPFPTNPPASAMPQPAPQFRTIDGNSDIDFDDASEPFVAPAATPAAEHSRLLSSATSAAVDSAFNALAQTVLVQNARTLEDLVREMLRPMLKTWLDDNLPGMVERLVRAEIERVSRGHAG